MEKIHVTCFCDAPNSVIVQTPNRSFPGMVFQGDSLRILYTKVERGIESLDAGNLSEASEYLSEIAEELQGRLEMYENVLESHGIPLPYTRPVSKPGANDE
jgi:hypothetical protein